MDIDFNMFSGAKERITNDINNIKNECKNDNNGIVQIVESIEHLVNSVQIDNHQDYSQIAYKLFFLGNELGVRIDCLVAAAAQTSQPNLWGQLKNHISNMTASIMAAISAMKKPKSWTISGGVKAGVFGFGGNVQISITF